MQNRKIMFPGKMKVELVTEAFDVKKLKPTEIAIKTKYSLISAGTELAIFMGQAPWFALPGSPGYLNLGEVLATGKAVKDFKKGDMVFTSNSHAEYHTYDLSNVNDLCVKLPDGVKHEEACFSRMGAVSLTGLRMARIELGDFVGVAGLGVIGNLAAQLAQLQGATVIGMDISEKRLQIAKQCGIEHVVKMGDKEALRKSIMAITGGAGISTFIEATGYSEAVLEVLPSVAGYGEVILLGTPRTECQADLTSVLKYIHNSSSPITFKGAHARSIPFQPDPFVKHSHVRNVRTIFGALKKGQLKVQPMLTHVMKPADCAKAYEGLRFQKDKFVTVMFDWR